MRHIFSLSLKLSKTHCFMRLEPLPVMDQEPEFKPSGMLCVFLGLLPTGAILSEFDDPDYPGGSIRFSAASYQPTRCGSW